MRGTKGRDDGEEMMHASTAIDNLKLYAPKPTQTAALKYDIFALFRSYTESVSHCSSKN